MAFYNYVEPSLIILDTNRLCSKIVRYFDQQDLPSIETLRLLSSALAALGSLQPGACRILYMVDPLVSVSNYYLETVKTAAATFIASMRMCIKRGRGCSVHMRMKPPFPNPGSAISLQCEGLVSTDMAHVMWWLMA